MQIFSSGIDLALLQFFNGSNSPFLDGMMAALTNGFTWIPLYLALVYLVVKNNETMMQILLVVGCVAFTMILSAALTDGVVKPLFGRLRPSLDPAVVGSLDLVGNIRGTGFSFFSAHAANTMAVAVFFSLLVRNRLFSAFMTLWSLLNGYTRLYLGVHYPLDVAVGFVWGAMSGLAGYLLWHKIYFKISPRLNYISTQYTSSGYALSDIDVVIAVMVFTLVLCMIVPLALSGAA